MTNFLLCSDFNSNIIYFVPLIFFETREIAYNVIALDNMKKPIIIKDNDAKAMFVTI